MIAKSQVSAAERRAACEFGAGATPSQTLDSDEPRGAEIPIDHFVIVMQENRSFDHYFQGLPAAGQPDAEVAPRDFHNKDPKTGRQVGIFLQKVLCSKDVRHDWNSAHLQYDDGKMDGFVLTSNPMGARALAYYDATTLGYYYALANTFAIGDHYFASILGPTWPNRMFFHAASSFGHIGNTPPPDEGVKPSLFRELEQKGIPWLIYREGKTFEEKIFPALYREHTDRFRDIEEFFSDAKANALPAYVWLESSYGGPSATDEHPPADIELGQALVARVIKALMESAAWKRSALFIMYDEPGGFFDHVPPPPACAPDELPPLLEKRHLPGGFDRLGMRVPLIVVSPFAKQHYVSHTVYSHTSIVRMVEARYELPALSKRDANSSIPYDLFDFSSPPFLVPPVLPEARVDQPALRACVRAFKKKKKGGRTDANDYGKAEGSAASGDPEGPPDEPSPAH
ncbi:MAG TPA: alkaline phosphatase family protein [Polyangiaceae bacterium]